MIYKPFHGFVSTYSLFSLSSLAPLTILQPFWLSFCSWNYLYSLPLKSLDLLFFCRVPDFHMVSSFLSHRSPISALLPWPPCQNQTLPLLYLLHISYHYQQLPCSFFSPLKKLSLWFYYWKVNPGKQGPCYLVWHVSLGPRSDLAYIEYLINEWMNVCTYHASHYTCL